MRGRIAGYLEDPIVVVPALEQAPGFLHVPVLRVHQFEPELVCRELLFATEAAQSEIGDVDADPGHVAPCRDGNHQAE